MGNAAGRDPTTHATLTDRPQPAALAPASPPGLIDAIADCARSLRQCRTVGEVGYRRCGRPDTAVERRHRKEPHSGAVPVRHTTAREVRAAAMTRERLHRTRQPARRLAAGPAAVGPSRLTCVSSTPIRQPHNHKEAAANSR